MGKDISTKKAFHKAALTIFFIVETKSFEVSN